MRADDGEHKGKEGERGDGEGEWGEVVRKKTKKGANILYIYQGTSDKYGARHADTAAK